jgi:hypothetical protein
MQGALPMDDDTAVPVPPGGHDIPAAVYPLLQFLMADTIAVDPLYKD